MGVCGVLTPAFYVLNNSLLDMVKLRVQMCRLVLITRERRSPTARKVYVIYVTVGRTTEPHTVCKISLNRKKPQGLRNHEEGQKREKMAPFMFRLLVPKAT